MKKELRTVIVILLMALSVFAGWYLGANLTPEKESKNAKEEVKENVNKEQKDEEKEEETDKEVVYEDWMKYILNADIKSISYFEGYADQNEEEEIHVDLTIDDLKAIFSGLVLNNKSIIRYYTDGIGFTGGYVLTVEYVKNNVTYTFEMANGFIFCDDAENNSDEEFYSLLDKADYKIVDNTTAGADVSSDEYLYRYEDLTIFEEYFCEYDNTCTN